MGMIDQRGPWRPVGSDGQNRTGAEGPRSIRLLPDSDAHRASVRNDDEPTINAEDGEPEHPADHAADSPSPSPSSSPMVHPIRDDLAHSSIASRPHSRRAMTSADTRVPGPLRGRIARRQQRDNDALAS